MAQTRTADYKVIISFIILCPMFFAFYALREIGIVSISVSYFALAISSVFILMIPAYVTDLIFRRCLPKPDFLFLVAVSCWGVVLFFSWPTATQEIDIRPIYSVAGITWLSLYMLFSTEKDSDLLGKVAAYSFYFTSAVVLVFSLPDFVFSLGVSHLTTGNEGAPTYQFFALIYVANLIFHFVTTGQNRGLAALVISIPILFLIGARTEMFVLCCCFVMVALFTGATRIFLLSVVFFLVLLSATQAVEFNRIAFFFENGGGHNVSMRLESITQARELIGQNVILGAAGNYEIGLYAHSIISMWVDFGALGFFSYALLVLYFFRASYRLRYITNSRGSPVGTFTFAFFVSLVPVMLFLKSADYYLMPIVFGLVRHTSRFAVMIGGGIDAGLRRDNGKSS